MNMFKKMIAAVLLLTGFFGQNNVQAMRAMQTHRTAGQNAFLTGIYSVFLIGLPAFFAYQNYKDALRAWSLHEASVAEKRKQADARITILNSDNNRIIINPNYLLGEANDKEAGQRAEAAKKRAEANAQKLGRDGKSLRTAEQGTQDSAISINSGLTTGEYHTAAATGPVKTPGTFVGADKEAEYQEDIKHREAQNSCESEQIKWVDDYKTKRGCVANKTFMGMLGGFALGLPSACIFAWLTTPR